MTARQVIPPTDGATAGRISGQFCAWTPVGSTQLGHSRSGQNRIFRTRLGAIRIHIPRCEASSGKECSSLELCRAFSVIRSTSLFSTLSSDQIELLARQSLTRVYGAGEVLPINKQSSFLMLSGSGALSRVSLNGKELSLRLLGEGDSLTALLFLMPTVGNIRFVSSSEVLILSSTALQLLIERQRLFSVSVIEELAHHVEQAFEFARSLAYDRAEQRLASMLFTLAERRGLELLLTRAELSVLTGLTTETAFRVTKDMERRGILHIGRPGHITIKNLEELSLICQS